MFKNKLFIILFILSFHAVKDYSQNDSINTFEYDYCLFRGENSKSIIELYYSFKQNQLVFVKNENDFEADGTISFTVTDMNLNKTVIDKEYKVPLTVMDTAGYNRNTTLLGQVNIILDTGSYKLEIKGGDFNKPAGQTGSTEVFKIVPFPETKVVTSSIQLSTNITKSNDPTGIFYKNTLDVEPNPSRIYGNNFSKLYYYFEIYNLRKELISDEYTVSVSILDNDGVIIKTKSNKFKVRNESKVETGFFDIKDLKTNVYNIVADVKGGIDSSVYEVKKRFYVYNSGSVSENQELNDDILYQQSDIAALTKEELMKQYEQSAYLMKEAAKETFEKLANLTQQKKYFYHFWKSLDPIPSTPFNEFKKEYFERIKYSNKNFKYQNKEGWQTDRGRVYSVYGKPSDVEKHYFEGNSKAYEIWKYDNLQGGVEFDFIDITSDGGDFRLVNSTARTEFRDDNWKQKLPIKN